MKRVLIYLLLLINLCSGTALAWDSHPETVVEQDTVTAIDQQLADPHNHPDSDWHHANHCCHGAAHFTGFVAETAVLAVTSDRQLLAHHLAALPSLYITPHLRPPIS